MSYDFEFAKIFESESDSAVADTAEQKNSVCSPYFIYKLLLVSTCTWAQ
jgi:hypothetical protein